MDFETHRVLSRSGACQGLVYRLGLGDRYVLRRRIDNYAARDKFFESFAKLDAWVRQRRWTLEQVAWFTLS